MRLVACLLALLPVCASPSSAQTATQGDPAKVTDPNAFHSPVIVETVFPAADRSLWNNGKEFSIPEWWELGKLSCDGVYFRSDSDRKTKWDPAIKLKVRDSPGGNVEIKMMVAVQNPKHNHDKMVTLLLEVVDGDDVLASQSVRIKAPDNGEGQQEENVRFTLPLSSLKLVPMTKLRITMRTQDY